MQRIKKRINFVWINKEKFVNKIYYDNDRRKAKVKLDFLFSLYNSKNATYSGDFFIYDAKFIINLIFSQCWEFHYTKEAAVSHYCETTAFC